MSECQRGAAELTIALMEKEGEQSNCFSRNPKGLQSKTLQYYVRLSPKLNNGRTNRIGRFPTEHMSDKFIQNKILSQKT